MKIHVDGARLANAAAALGISLGEAAVMFDADVISMGGTKNGLMGAEAVVFVDPGLGDQAKVDPEGHHAVDEQAPLSGRAVHRTAVRRPVAGATPSFPNTMARQLGERLVEVGVALTQPVEVNAVFAILPGARRTAGAVPLLRVVGGR